MKNIYLLPTDKPSRLHFWTVGKGPKLELCELEYSHTRNTQHIYITSDEEIKEGDWYLDTFNTQRIKANQFSDHKHYGNACKKIILTTDQDLIKDGVQAIDDEFLEWFVNNSSCESVEIERIIIVDTIPRKSLYDYKIIIPQEEPKIVTVNAESATGEYLATVSYIPLPHLDYTPKQETLEEVAERLKIEWKIDRPQDFIEGAKWQAERMYSEEDMKESFINGALTDLFNTWGISDKDMAKEKFHVWFEQFRKK
jgi:hypothetical protein